MTKLGTYYGYSFYCDCEEDMAKDLMGRWDNDINVRLCKLTILECSWFARLKFLFNPK